jgi:hypothetical protein
MEAILIGLGVTIAVAYFMTGHSTKRRVITKGDTTVTYETGHDDAKQRSIGAAIGMTLASVMVLGPLGPLLLLVGANEGRKERATMKMRLEQRNANGSTHIYAETPKTATNQHLADD